MPLVLPGSLALGPRSVPTPATLVAYLNSISKASWYANWIATYGLAPISDGSGGTVADGGAVGCWTPIQQVGFNQKLIQATSASRPALGASRDGSPAIYGNGISWSLNLDSTTALNGAHTVLISGWFPSEPASVYSHNGLSNAMRTTFNAMDSLYVGNVFANTAPQAWRKSLSGANNRVRLGWTNSGTAHNGTAPHLLRRSSAGEYSTSSLMQIVVCPALTADEILAALAYLV